MMKKIHLHDLFGSTFNVVYNPENSNPDNPHKEMIDAAIRIDENDFCVIAITQTTTVDGTTDGFIFKQSIAEFARAIETPIRVVENTAFELAIFYVERKLTDPEKKTCFEFLDFSKKRREN